MVCRSLRQLGTLSDKCVQDIYLKHRSIFTAGNYANDLIQMMKDYT